MVIGYFISHWDLTHVKLKLLRRDRHFLWPGSDFPVLTLTVKHKTVYLISVVTEVQKWVQFNIFKEVLMVVSMLMDRIGQWKVLKRESIHVH